MKKERNNPNSHCTEALALVFDNRFRRISTTYTDTKTGKYNVSVYRVSESIVRAEFSKPQPKLKNASSH